jgi:hypothetical protein
MIGGQELYVTRTGVMCKEDRSSVLGGQELCVRRTGLEGEEVRSQG